MEIFYHGSSVLFDRFDLSHVLEGDGKVKFGYGVYLTSSFKSAAHYSGANKSATTHFVYTVEIPELTDDNHIDFKQPVHLDIVKRAEQKLGHTIPQKFTLDGKDFRKYLAKILGGGSDVRSEKLASEFLNCIGVEFITWPYSWKIRRIMFYRHNRSERICLSKLQHAKPSSGISVFHGKDRDSGG